MSAILGVFGSGGTLSDGQVHAMLGRMSARGTDRVQVWRNEDTVLAVSRYEWELESAFSGPVLIAEDDDFAVAADATIYYRDDLTRALAAHGVTARSAAPAHLVLAAYRAWGDDCVNHLEGDFSFIVWDRNRKRAFCARDFSGKRPIHYAQLGRELVFASTIGGVLAHPRCPDDLNLAVIGGTIPGMIFSGGPETSYEAIHSLPSGHGVTWFSGKMSEPSRYWQPPVDGTPSRLTLRDGAERLRELLSAAALQRLRSDDTNTVWMSGGWDSTAVFGAAHYGAQQTGMNLSLRPVSISYPAGDPGREDDWINAVAARWQTPVHWIDIADIPFLDDEAARAEARDEPHAHLYAHWNTALARGTRGCGSRIALDGNGGDQLFASSDIFLADLLRSGRWLSLAREWPARKRGGYREFFSTVIQPNLSPAMLSLAARLRGGRPLKHYLDRGMPAWMDPRFIARHGLDSRDAGLLGRREPRTESGREVDWFFTCQFVARAFSLLDGFALQNGVELRSPLYDRRVIEFAMSRPWWERSSGKETKLLLRRAMKGLLPDEVLDTRPYRTGITAGYSHRWMSNVFPRILSEVMADGLVLADLGIVQPDVLREACAAYPRRRDASTRVALFQTLQTELWLRARIRDGMDSVGTRERDIMAASVSS